MSDPRSDNKAEDVAYYEAPETVQHTHLGVDPRNVRQPMRLAGVLWPRALCGRWLL